MLVFCCWCSLGVQGVLALRNLCEGNESIQDFLAGMEAQGAATQSFDDEELQRLGMEISMAGGKPKVVKKKGQ